MTKKKKEKVFELSWKPQKHGDIYCSPACGGNCKHSDFNHAWEMAKMLAKVMGIGWSPHVWENLGWHWKVCYGDDISMTLTNGTYTAYAHASFIGGLVATARSPHTALAGIRKQAADRVRAATTLLDRLTECSEQVNRRRKKKCIKSK